MKSDHSLKISTFNFSKVDSFNVNSLNLNNGQKYSLWHSSKLFSNKHMASSGFDYNRCNFIYGSYFYSNELVDDFKFKFKNNIIYFDPFVQLQQLSIQLQSNSNLEQYNMDFNNNIDNHNNDKVEYNFASINICGKYSQKFDTNSKLAMLVQHYNINILSIQEIQEAFASYRIKIFNDAFKVLDFVNVGDAVRNDIAPFFNKLTLQNKKSNHITAIYNNSEKLIFGTLYVSNWDEDRNIRIDDIFHDVFNIFSKHGVHKYKTQIGGDWNAHLGEHVDDTYPVQTQTDTNLINLINDLKLIILNKFKAYGQYK